jgi:hypothetical protein
MKHRAALATLAFVLGFNVTLPVVLERVGLPTGNAAAFAVPLARVGDVFPELLRRVPVLGVWWHERSGTDGAPRLSEGLDLTAGLARDRRAGQG